MSTFIVILINKNQETMAKKIVRYIYRDAKTGRLVSEEYAKKNPNTTVREAVYE